MRFIRINTGARQALALRIGLGTDIHRQLNVLRDIRGRLRLPAGFESLSKECKSDNSAIDFASCS